MFGLKPTFSRLLVIVAVICALAGSSYAHRFVSADLDPALQAYLDAGGSLDSICGDVGGHSGQSYQQCDICHLVGAAIIPVITTAPSCCRCRPVARLSNTDAQVLHPTYLHQTRKPRGPPHV